MWMLEEPERDAVIVGQGLALMSIDLPSVTEVICSRTPCQLQNLKRAYYIKYNSQLVKHIDSFTSLVMGRHKEVISLSLSLSLSLSAVVLLGCNWAICGCCSC